MTYEKSADELEMAEHLREQETLAGRRQSEAALAPQEPKGFDGVHCTGCGDELAPVRIAYKRCRCTPCQVAEESRMRRRGAR